MDFFSTPGGDKYARASKPNNTVKRSIPTPIVTPKPTSSSSSSRPTINRSKSSIQNNGNGSIPKLTSRNRPPQPRSSATPSDDSPRRPRTADSQSQSRWPSTPSKRRRRPVETSESSSTSSDEGITRTPRKRVDVGRNGSGGRPAGEGVWDDVGEIKPRDRKRRELFDLEALEGRFSNKEDGSAKRNDFVHSADMVRKNLAKYRPCKWLAKPLCPRRSLLHDSTLKIVCSIRSDIYKQTLLLNLNRL